MKRRAKGRSAAAGLIVTALVAGGGAPATAHPDAGPNHCWVDHDLVGEAECQERADADWEGLSQEEQDSIRATKLTGTRLDQLVIDFRRAILAAACGRR